MALGPAFGVCLLPTLTVGRRCQSRVVDTLLLSIHGAHQISSGYVPCVCGLRRFMTTLSTRWWFQLQYSGHVGAFRIESHISQPTRNTESKNGLAENEKIARGLVRLPEVKQLNMWCFGHFTHRTCVATHCQDGDELWTATQMTRCRNCHCRERGMGMRRAGSSAQGCMPITLQLAIRH